MKMTSSKRALDKIYKRRNRYEIPEWQRGEVWDLGRKQCLIDSILKGWKLPKFYFIKKDDDDFEVLDGQQRLVAIFEFFSNELALNEASTAEFGGPLYKDLKTRFSDSFDDFEIEYDGIENSNEEELKNFFQRLQQGLPLTSSEKLNSVHSKLRDYCRSTEKHAFFTKSVGLANTRLAHFDVISKVCAIEIGGIENGVRFEDIKEIFEDNKTFSNTSKIAKRIKATLDVLAKAFTDKDEALRNRTVIQSIITFTCRLSLNWDLSGHEEVLGDFFRQFMDEFARQIELGQDSTDGDYIKFQKTINANIKTGAKTRQEILTRKAILFQGDLFEFFSLEEIKGSGVNSEIKKKAESIANHIHRINAEHAAINGDDLFKATNKTTQALLTIGKQVTSVEAYGKLIDQLYFLFRESIGTRMGTAIPPSFVDINTLRTDLQHDVDHGDGSKVRAKRKKAGSVFHKFSGSTTPTSLDRGLFPLVQARIMTELESDLASLAYT